MPPTLKQDHIVRLRDLILNHAVKGDVARRVVEYLCSADAPERISAQDITDHGGPIGDTNVCPFMSRLRDPLSDFFDYHPVGRKESLRVVLPSDDRGNYALQFLPNTPPDNLVPSFWSPHFPCANALVIYPEMPVPLAVSKSVDAPQSSSSNVVLIRPVPDDQEADCPPGGGVVSGSIVRSLLRLGDCFRKWQVRVTAAGVRPAVDMLDADDIIVLATPGTMPVLLPNLEAAARMKTGADAVTVMGDIKEGRKTYTDVPPNGLAANGAEMVKWGVLTRHRYRFQRTLTVLAARDEIAVEAMVQFLINEEAMLMLSKELRCGDKFPDHFQALFRMHIFKGHPHAREMTVEQAIDIGVNGKGALAKKSA